MPHQKTDLEPGDFHVVVKRNNHVEPSWRWEIFAAGRAKFILRADKSFPTMTEATREGKAALKTYIEKEFPQKRDGPASC
jgi:hypothetical protein